MFFSICSRCSRSENNLNFAKQEIVRSIRLSRRSFSDNENGVMVLDSWLDSVYPDDSWKWIHHLPTATGFPITYPLGSNLSDG